MKIKKMEIFFAAVIILSIIGLALGLIRKNIQRVQAAEKVTEEEGMEDGMKKYAALTFDDGPNPEYTETLLEVLDSKDVKATFFLLGNQVELYPELVKKIQAKGHLIGNHTYSHVNLSCLSEEAACLELKKTSDAIHEVTGEYPEYFRPPFGSVQEKLDADLVMMEVLWDVDTRDWASQNVEKIMSRVQNVQDGDIILMHDAYASSIAAVPQIIDKLRSEGYEFVTVDKLICP